MVMPLFDDNRDRQTIPFVNYALIAVNLIIFVGLQQLGANWRLTNAYALVPEEIRTGRDIQTPNRARQNPSTGQYEEVPGLQPTPISPYLTLLTSMFLHGSLLHLLGNLLFLWVFGDNVEDRLGHVRYLGFYLLCGLIASGVHVAYTLAAQANTLIPCIGASGAISGVLAGYLLLFPHKQVTVLILRVLMNVPAWVAIGLWFLFQLIEGLGALGHSSGVAYSAHIGGFVAGLLLVKMFAIGRPEPQKTRAW